MSEIIRSIKDFSKLKENKIIYSNKKNIVLNNTTISFSGTNNILYLNTEKTIVLEDCDIEFNGNNSLIYLNENFHKYCLKVFINNNNVLYFGKNNYFNKVLQCIISEEKNVIIGDNCLFSTNICMRTADPHLMYSMKTKRRINYSKSIYIGDHVWIGQDVIVLKGAKIGSGSIIGAKSLISTKFPSNCVGGGIPAKVIKKKVFWDSPCVHKYTKKETMDSSLFKKKNNFIYREKNNIINVIEKELNDLTEVNDKLLYINKNLINKTQNRFAIGNKQNNKVKMLTKKINRKIKKLRIKS